MADELVQVAEAVEKVLIAGDLSPLTPEQRVVYYNNVCRSVGVNPLTKPFSYIILNGKLVLYANKECAEQLRKIHRISMQIVSREKVGDLFIVTARATGPDGRFDESTGAVFLGKNYGDSLANLYMKAETKAKRRITLSFCGLGMLDESEIETIKDARKVEDDYISSKQISKNSSNGNNSENSNKEEETSATPSEFFDIDISYHKQLFKTLMIELKIPFDSFLWYEVAKRLRGKKLKEITKDSIKIEIDLLQVESQKNEP